jgi:hypothetical protein
LAILLAGVAPFARAGVLGFTGPYDPSQWTLTNNPPQTGGSVNTSGAPSSVTIIGGDNGVKGLTTWTIIMPGSGLVSFDWSYVTTDSDGPFYDPAGFTVNGAHTKLTDDDGANSQSGSWSGLGLNAGDQFSFWVYTLDGIYGPGSLTISNFQAPGEAIPEPATLLLVGVPLAVGAFRRRAHKG